MTMVSSCCGCEMDGIMTDVEICPECEEHCECECDICGNSGVVRNDISREWESCECGCEFNGERAESFYQMWDHRKFC